jgi:isopentenyl-diphosphate delta-isomerase
MKEYLILTDENDHPLGMMEKFAVHKLGLLHRAFSIFIFNSKGEVLLQQRAHDKYHSGGLWSNTCCSHPRYEEKITDAVDRRLWEEMGLQSDTDFAFSFIYKAIFENGLTEHEYDHVFTGISDAIPTPDKTEVSNWKYLSLPALQNDINQYPATYTEWLKICLPRMINYCNATFFKPTSNILAHVSI